MCVIVANLVHRHEPAVLPLVAECGERRVDETLEAIMPDWFYRTVSQPILFRLPAVTARDLALGFMGQLARLPLGPSIIHFLGHMRPDPRLRRSFAGIDFPTAVGLGPGVDTNAAALPALARFGFGFLEI